MQGLSPEEITGPGGLSTQLAGRVIETALRAELTEHLGIRWAARATSANVRNGAGVELQIAPGPKSGLMLYSALIVLRPGRED